MAKRNQGAANTGEGNEFAVVIGIGLVLFMLWMAFHTKITNIIFNVRLAESWIFTFFTRNLDELRLWMQTVPRDTVTAGDLVTVSSRVGSYVRFITIPILMGIGFWLFRKSPTEKFRRRYTDQTLPPAVADDYPWIKISTKLDFSKLDTDKGPWALALSERQFTRLHKLKDANGQIDRDKAESVFIKQLGNMWLGYGNLKPYAKGLFALFAARANKDFGTGDKLLMQLARSAADGKIDYTGVDELAKKYMDSKPVKRVLARHGFEKTVLMGMLEAARGGENGKDYLPPNWFLWLKGVDRPLWYALSDVGRKTPHVESAGVFFHFLVEKARKKKLEMPYVKNAVDGLIIEMAKFLNDDDDEDEGISDDDEVRDIKMSAKAPDIPSPQEAEAAFKSGKGSSLKKPVLGDDED